ncbi:MAG TPA: glycine--tRNA ligase subunit beta [Thermotogota bacterium]|nr:glycine--tRNA ligase subunit beta [Thermotogota bacterium]
MAWMFFWISVALGADQLSKWVVEATIPLNTSIPLFPPFFRLFHVHNQGIAFGLFQAQSDFLLPLVLVIIIVVTLFSFKYAPKSPWLLFSFGAIIGGALGNIVDRFFRGAVVDFISVGSFAIFNLADSFVVVGAICLGIFALFFEEKADATDFFVNPDLVCSHIKPHLPYRDVQPADLDFLVHRLFRVSEFDLEVKNPAFFQDFSPPPAEEQGFSTFFCFSLQATGFEDAMGKVQQHLSALPPLTQKVLVFWLDAEKPRRNMGCLPVDLHELATHRLFLHFPHGRIKKRDSGKKGLVLRIIGKTQTPFGFSSSKRKERKKVPQGGTHRMNPAFCLEIQTEELPPSEVHDLLATLHQKMLQFLESKNITFSEVQTFLSSRRFGILIPELCRVQKDRSETRKGPSESVAFQQDPEGNSVPSRALLGFLHSNQANLDQVEIREEKGGRYVFLHRNIPGKPTLDVLSEHLPGIIESLSFKKPMRWGNGEIRFVRPVHHIVALLDDQVVPFTCLGVSSGNRTVAAHLEPEGFLLENAADYVTAMKEHGVLVHIQDREQHIVAQLQQVASAIDKQPAVDASLVQEVALLTENPRVVVGSFDKDFLELPEPVLITTLKHHQKSFPFFEDEHIAASFASFQDNGSLADDNVKKGYQRVVRARLEDARFFFREDQKKALESHTEELQGIIFQRKLGTLYDKVERLERNARFYAEKLDLSATQVQDVSRAARLCKCDLQTHMVYEFPELQGTMGGIYARLQGEPESVCSAIEEHYASTLPSSVEGALLAIADQIDNIAGNLLLGQVPTGSRDPFGLRRQALSLVEILVSFEWDVDLHSFFDQALSGYDQFVSEVPLAREAFRELLSNRLEAFLQSKGFDQDVLQAVRPLSAHPLRAFLCASALHQKKSQGTIEPAIRAFERVYNISRSHASCDFDSRLFEQEEESQLLNAFSQMKEVFSHACERLRYPEALDLLAALKPAVDAYFDAVFVMVDREDLKLTRLGFLKSMAKEFVKVGEINQINVETVEK